MEDLATTLQLKVCHAREIQLRQIHMKKTSKLVKVCFKIFISLRKKRKSV